MRVLDFIANSMLQAVGAVLGFMILLVFAGLMALAFDAAYRRYRQWRAWRPFVRLAKARRAAGEFGLRVERNGAVRERLHENRLNVVRQHRRGGWAS